eukprot:4904393-Amphidinium_carterae.2
MVGSCEHPFKFLLNEEGTNTSDTFTKLWATAESTPSGRKDLVDARLSLQVVLTTAHLQVGFHLDMLGFHYEDAVDLAMCSTALIHILDHVIIVILP